jgi:hypothetical protein
VSPPVFFDELTVREHWGKQMSRGPGRARLSLVAKAVLAFILAVPTALIAAGTGPAGVAGAAGYTGFTSTPCAPGANCVTIPLSSAGGPDETGGATSQSNNIMTYLYFYATVSPHTAANPLTIKFPVMAPGTQAVYHVDHTIRLANAFQAGDQMYPSFPAYDLQYTTIDLNGAKFDQRIFADDGATNNLGNAIISSQGVSNVTVKNGQLENTGFIGHTRGPAVEDWPGVRVGGQDTGHFSAHLNFTNLIIKRPGGDNVAVLPGVDDISVQNITMNNTGRDPVTFSGGTSLFFLNNEMHQGRFTFDSEPNGAADINNVWIAGNYAEGASFGFLQANAAPVVNEHDIVVANNTVDGLGGVALNSPNAARSNFTYSGNTLNCWSKQTASGVNFAHPVNTIGWNNVNATNNTFNVKSASWAFRFPQIDPTTGGPAPTGVVTTPNTYNQIIC